MPLNASRSAARLSRRALQCCRHQQAAASASAGAAASPLHRSAAAITTTTTSSNAFSTTSAARQSEQPAAAAEPRPLPRWAHTPEKMKATFSPHITKDPSRSIWKVNDDPKKLDEAMNRFLGRDGEKLLPDELKWLAVTHKSFDQGRRGFNDRLAFLGRQICTMEATQSIITSPANFTEPTVDPFADRRQPFENPDLRSLDNLSENQPQDLFSFEKLAKIANDCGLSDVVRWKPRMPEKLQVSGYDPVMAGAVFAIVGAVALQHGGKTASRVVRERILRRLRSAREAENAREARAAERKSQAAPEGAQEVEAEAKAAPQSPVIPDA